jgi:hypothetical protein
MTYLPITNGPVVELQATTNFATWSGYWRSSVTGAVSSVTTSNLPDGRLALEIPVAITNHPAEYFRLQATAP